MYIWLSLAILAQVLTAGSVLVDKYLLLNEGSLGKPVVYAFYISLLSGVVLILVPFGYISIPSLYVVELSIATAIAYILSLILLYRSLKEAVPSDVMPVVGACTAVSSYLLTYYLLDTDLPMSFGLSFILLVVGTLLISHFRFNTRSFLIIVFAGFFFGLSSVLIKLVFIGTGSFIDGFFWSRMANVFGALLLLLWPGNLKAILHGVTSSKKSEKGLVLFNKILSGCAFILTLRAIDLGNVPLVNALGGLQFVFLFAFAYVFAGVSPKIFHGEVRPHEFAHKLFGTILIVGGLGLLFAPSLFTTL